MHEFDDKLPARRYDNFQFVEYNKIANNPHIENFEVAVKKDNFINSHFFSFMM